ncbi:hypothetical protein OF83DRAFT_1031145, partial [Amylostereum chailletii]
PLTERLNLLSIPVPPSTSILDVTLLSLISTFLSNVIVSVSHLLAGQPANAPLAQLATILQTSPSIMTWVPICAQLPAKHRDTLLTRIYSALTKSIGHADADPSTMFRIR